MPHAKPAVAAAAVDTGAVIAPAVAVDQPAPPLFQFTFTNHGPRIGTRALLQGPGIESNLWLFDGTRMRHPSGEALTFTSALTAELAAAAAAARPAEKRRLDLQQVKALPEEERRGYAFVGMLNDDVHMYEGGTPAYQPVVRFAWESVVRRDQPVVEQARYDSTGQGR